MIESAVGSASLAERKRQLVRDDLTDAALTLLATRGFEETTVEEIVAVAGVSRRTFFRYFRSKEDVVVEHRGDWGAVLRAELAVRPAGETPAQAVRGTLVRFGGHHDAGDARALALSTLTVTTPALFARYLERQAHWRAQLTEELAARAGAAPATDLRSALTVAVGFAAFDTALSAWVADGGARTLRGRVEEAFDLVKTTC
ncbi:TetR family transcriptional regulator [Umezawaea beigongshangensis]|uniref:TetR family transcriptional regulator n=1 Tax=Umezawaea beigongshangensis TaxID=2780383 RepID=UPI0018F1D82C|nr:TetR family transcriptional regulator [Umezawaea beigongshangensis]